MKLWRTSCVVLPVLCWCMMVSGGFSEEPAVVIWDKTARVDLGIGYHDNVLRSSIAPKGSGYVRATADASLIRLSSSERVLVVFLLAEDTRYFEVPVNYEQFFSVTAQFSSPAGEEKTVGSELNYLYQHQIFDASESEADLYRVLVMGHGIKAKVYWEMALNERWAVRAEGTGLRQIYEDELDDYREGSARFSLIRKYGHRSEASLNYEVLRRDYDTRNRFDATGVMLAGTDLFYAQQEIEGEWKHYFDADRKWRLTSRVSCMQNEDNGSGYFDYTRVLLREQLRWRAGAWSLKATCRAGWYRYALQRVDGERRERSYFVASLRSERKLSDHWRVYIAGEHEWDESNDALDEYRDWYVESGLACEF